MKSPPIAVPLFFSLIQRTFNTVDIPFGSAVNIDIQSFLLVLFRKAIYKKDVKQLLDFMINYL